MYDVDGNGWIDLEEMTRLVGSIYKMLGQHQLVQQVSHAVIGTMMGVTSDMRLRRRRGTGPGRYLRGWTPTMTAAWPGTSSWGAAWLTRTWSASSLPPGERTINVLFTNPIFLSVTSTHLTFKLGIYKSMECYLFWVFCASAWLAWGCGSIFQGSI